MAGGHERAPSCRYRRPGPVEGGPADRPEAAQAAEQPGALVRLAAGATLVVGNEGDLGRPAVTGQQGGGVEVGVARPGSEVQVGAGGADDGALLDMLTAPDGDGGQERVARADAVGVEDDDVQ